MNLCSDLLAIAVFLPQCPRTREGSLGGSCGEAGPETEAQGLPASVQPPRTSDYFVLSSALISLIRNIVDL